MRALTLALLLGVSACGDDDSRPSPRPVGETVPPAVLWQIGPEKSGGGSYSVNMPDHPSPHPEGWVMSFGPGQEPHYVTYRHGSLSGRSQIRMRYRVETDPGVVIHGKECPVTSQSAVTLFFQREGGLGGDGDRWWATWATVPLTGAGEWEIVASLDGPWTSVENLNTGNAPEKFASAKRDADRVGFTLANCVGYGHGATATGPVRFIVTEFRVL